MYILGQLTHSSSQACEALIQLSRTDSRGPSRSSEGSGSERRGSPSETQPLQTLREAVWSKAELQRRSLKVYKPSGQPSPSMILPRQRPLSKRLLLSNMRFIALPSIIDSLTSPPLKERFFLLKPNVSCMSLR